jgi:hypothetical protein
VIGVTHTGSFKNTERFMKRMVRRQHFPSLDTYGQRGVDALSNATPKDTRETSKRWRYKIEQDHTGITISWHNDNEDDGVPIVILIQYGHGTGTGGYVQGRDFINPAMQLVFDQIAEEMWKKVTR